jgi:twinkle protein
MLPHRLRPGEVSIIAGYNSHGKSTVALQLISYLVKKHFLENIEICLATMEGNINSQIARIVKYYLAQDGLAMPKTREEFISVSNDIGQAISLYNEPGDGKVKNVLECFRYARSRYGADLFLVDNLTSLDVGIEDYEGQRKFVQKILAFAKTENVHVVIVAHMRKPQGFSDSPPGRYSLRGSSSIADLVDNFFVIWRNENGNAKFPPAVFKCDKDRENGILQSVSLSFNPEIGFVEEIENGQNLLD